jgi:tetratricopeptide (TPR) repeat protein
MRVLFVACLVAIAGCGGGAAATTTPTTHAPSAAIDPEAVSEFQAGTREMEHDSRAAARRARDHFEAALTVDPTLWEAHYQIGVLDRRAGDLQSAATSFEAARLAAPETPEVLVALAEVRHQLGDRGTAASLLRAYVGAHPDELAPRLSLATILREGQDYDGALEQAREVLIRQPSTASALAEVGRVYRARAQYDVAELVIRKALDLGDTAELRNDLGLVQLGRGDTQAAFEEFDRAIALDAHFAPAHLNQGSVLLHAGDYAGAATHYQAVVDADADNLDARVALGIALRGQGHIPEARRAYQAVLDAQPTHAQALFDMGVLLAEFADDRPHAREMFQRYLEVAPSGAPQRETAQHYVTDIGAELAPPAPTGPRS